jgi:hypothetical protein
MERVLPDIDAHNGDRRADWLRHGVLLGFRAPCQLRLLAGQEHGRTIPLSEDWAMQAVMTMGLDIAKSVFQVHGVDAEGNVVVRRKPKRQYVVPFFQKLPPCLVGIEACASSHHWSRELQTLGQAFNDGNVIGIMRITDLIA